MIQYYIPQISSQVSLVHETIKVTVETTLKQLEYITKGHITMHTILF